MPWSPPTPVVRTALLLGAVSSLAGGCPNRKTPKDAVIEEHGEVQSIEVPMAVVSVSPDKVGPNHPVAATVRGSGFAPGASVYVGEQQATDVSFQGETSLSLTLPALPVGRYDVEVVNPDNASSVLRQGLTVDPSAGADCERVVVYFGLDQSGLAPDATSTLTERLDCWTASSATIVVEGHTDERSTNDYNLALGERRASSVASWLATRGVPRSRIEVVSYGEVRPADPGHDEGAWAKNRRAEILLK